MDSIRAARYPFLRESAKFAESNSADIESLVFSPSYENARKRGLERVKSAIDQYCVSDVSLLQEYDRLMEVLSYPYARMIVSVINDRFLTKRYALAEASRMNDLLQGDIGSEITVAQELEVNSSRDKDGKINMHFGDYLRFSHVMKAVEWKLINTDLRNGYVHLDAAKFDRLLQNSLQERIERELPLNVPAEFQKAMKPDIDHILILLSETKKKLSPTGGEGMNPDFLPPCIKQILANAQNGMNLPHSARFALVSFLNALGLTYEQIIALFAQSPDFDESKSSYQIKHITGEERGGEGYTPPECSTMKTNGICFDPDSLCNNGKMNHPLSYYRIKSGNFPKRDEEKK
ncbi:MAG: DNA primase large subunit PriL [Candidatus Methanoplasma sp.]|jgi:DNA primase large subunit|nr:DNA primase large subunit PriL [Candidatus Methanoplasma sp.]